MTDAAVRLTTLLDERSLVDAVLRDHPANDPATAPREAFLVHGCAILATALEQLGAGSRVVLTLDGELLHAAVRRDDGYLDADGGSDEAALRRRWAEIVECDPAALVIAPYDAEADAWFDAVEGELAAAAERLADELVRRDPDLVTALRG